MAAISGAAGGEASLAALLSTPRRGPKVAGYVAAPGDLIMGQFGWADATDQTIANTRTAPSQTCGYIVPQRGNWNLCYRSNGLWYLRSGFPATLQVVGTVMVRFAGGAIPGNPVYASLIDGSAISGYSANAELTRWFVITNAAPGQMATISTWSTFT